MPDRAVGFMRRVYRYMKRKYHGFLAWRFRVFEGIDPDKVVFMCFQGRSYGDNPRVVSERLHERCPQAKIFWIFRPGTFEAMSARVPDYVTPLANHSRECFRALGTARVWVDNFTRYNAVKPAKGKQFYIQTWHGDRPVKKICYDMACYAKKPYRIEELCDRVVTGSRFGEQMYRTAFRYRGEYLAVGAPRNDILLRGDPADVARVREKLGAAPGVRLLLYAPTYRENTRVVPKRAQMDLSRTLACLETKTGGRWLCLYRAHYMSEGIELEAVRDRVIDVTQYEDMAELLLVADMVLTDYSSCATDFILQDRPALFFASDLEEYLATRETYYDIHDAPFLLAEDQPALEALIAGLDEEKVRQNCADIRAFFGCYETGRAADAVCDYIIEKMRRPRPGAAQSGGD